MADASPDNQSNLTLSGEGGDRVCEGRPFGTSLHNLCSYMSASAGKRTRAGCVTGEHSTTEPPMQIIIIIIIIIIINLLKVLYPRVQRTV